MPNTTEEEGNGEDHVTSSFVIIPAWLRKFHFSGRVIMCSVLFGLGLVLLGGLVFAINMDDDSNKPNSENIDQQLPTKPPSKYVGPVIMGIGGFIVTVGIIMCLFETQVCRKTSGDSSPLITERTDPEGRVSGSAPVPSTSRGHKHGAQKASASPKKSKSKHVKSSSKGKSQQKNSSPRSPPISIEKSKSFMTSSEDTFLTPPNIPDTVLENSNSVENKATSSLMKSFTSSGPSLTQSTEFITPATSFKDTSTSVNSSVEVHEKQGQVSFKSSEFMTPLTVEEDRIQNLLIRVKNEQKEIAKREMEERNYDLNSSAGSENVSSDRSTYQIKVVKEDIQMNENEDKKLDAGSLPLSIPDGVSGLQDISPSQSTEFKSVDEMKVQNKEEVDCHDKCFASEVQVDGNELEQGIQHTRDGINEKHNSSIQDNEEQKSSSLPDSSSHTIEKKHDSNPHPSKETNDDVINASDLEISVSSDETVVSPDNCIDKSKKKSDGESTFENHSCTNSHSETRSILKSLGDDESAESTNPPNNPIKETEAEKNDFSHGPSDTEVDKDRELLPVDTSS